LQQIIEKLRSVGFSASMTALNPAAFKTDATIDRILDVLK
jgi:tRNA G26 N,N-dimethylase Trm1